jgi:Kdo2-lipid IVA lauroyltransferase/acyltransferase
MYMLLYRFFCFLGTYLPLKLIYFIAEILSKIKYLLSPGLRKTVKKNLKIILDYKGEPYDADILVKKVKKTYSYFGRYLADFFNMPKWDRKRVEKKVKFENIEVLEEALSRGNGAVIITCHIGNWDLAGITAALLGYKISAIAIPYLSLSVTEIYRQRRENKKVQVILTRSQGKLIVKALKENRILAVLADRPFTEKGRKVKFMGRYANLPRGPATLAVKTGAKFASGFFVMEGDHYRFFLIDIPQPAPHLTYEEKIEFLISQGAMAMEKAITAYPEQWLNFSDVWA